MIDVSMKATPQIDTLFKFCSRWGMAVVPAEHPQK